MASSQIDFEGVFATSVYLFTQADNLATHDSGATLTVNHNRPCHEIPETLIKAGKLSTRLASLILRQSLMAPLRGAKEFFCPWRLQLVQLY